MTFRVRCEANEAKKATKVKTMNFIDMTLKTQLDYRIGFNDQDSDPAYGMGSSTAVASDDLVAENDGGVTQRERSWIMSWMMNTLTNRFIVLAFIPTCAIRGWHLSDRELIIVTVVVGVVIACISRRKAIEEALKSDLSSSRRHDPEIQRIDTTPETKEEDFNLDAVKSLYWTHLAILSCGLALWGYSSYENRCLGMVWADCITAGYFIVFCNYIRAGLSTSPLTATRINETRVYSEGAWTLTMAMPGVIGRIRTRIYGGMTVVEMLWGKNACIGSNNTYHIHTRMIPFSVLLGFMLLATRHSKYSSAGVGKVIVGTSYLMMCCLGQHLTGGGLESHLYAVLFSIIGYGLGEIIISHIEASCAKDDIADQSVDLLTAPCFEMSATKDILFENNSEKCITKNDSTYTHMSGSSQEPSEDDGSDHDHDHESQRSSDGI